MGKLDEIKIYKKHDIKSTNSEARRLDMERDTKATRDDREMCRLQPTMARKTIGS